MTAAVLGSILYAAAGAVMGSMNADWIDVEPNANGLLPFLGIGAGFVVAAFRHSDVDRRLQQSGLLSRATRVLLVVGPMLYIASWIIEFAIFGTLTFGAGLVCLAVSVWRNRLVPSLDRILVAFSAVGSLTWNTETSSAFLLVGVGLIWVVLSVRMLSATMGSRVPLPIGPGSDRV